MPTADELYEEAKCFLCYGMTQAQALKLALLRRQALQLDPDADVSPETLLLNASCYNCYANGSVYDLFELALLAIIAATPCTPGNVDGLIWGPTPETVDSITGITDSLLANLDTWFNGIGLYTTLSFGNPTTVTNNVDFNNSTNLTSITFRLLNSVGAEVNFDTSVALESVSFPSLVSVGASFAFGSASALTTFSAPLLATIGDNLDFANVFPLTILSLPSLTTVGIQIIVSGGSIETLNFPSLSSYPPSGIAADASILTLNLPACVDDGAGQLQTDLGSMTGLVTLNLASIITITTNLILAASPNLASFTANAWVPTDGTTIDFNGCALDIASVELILRRCVLAGVTTCIIDLSGGTNAGTASLSAQGQADVATLGAQVTMNP